ncbi:response regulator [Streptomyces chartreusis]
MIDVLIVEDDFMVARIHRGFVNDVDGFRVIGTANCGEQAIAAVGELQPELVLLDLYLPDMFGLEIIPRLRTAGHDCDVMVISAARESEAVRGAVRQGVVDYLLKPFDADDLRTRLEQYAARRSNLYAAVSGQSDVDRALARGAAPTTAPAALPKGMSVETAELIERELRAADGSLSAAECAARSGVSRVSARRYLEHFSVTGRAEVSLRYGQAGRPERRYSWLDV